MSALWVNFTKVNVKKIFVDLLCNNSFRILNNFPMRCRARQMFAVANVFSGRRIM